MTKADKIFFITVGSFLALASCALSFALGQERGQRFPVKETNVVTTTNTVTVWLTNTIPCDHYKHSEPYVQLRIAAARRDWESGRDEVLANAQKAINRHATLSAELADWKLQWSSLFQENWALIIATNELWNSLQYRTKELDLAFQAKGHPEEITRLKDEIIRLKGRVNEVLEMKAGWRNEEVEKLYAANRNLAGTTQAMDLEIKQLKKQLAGWNDKLYVSVSDCNEIIGRHMQANEDLREQLEKARDKADAERFERRQLERELKELKRK